MFLRPHPLRHRRRRDQLKPMPLPIIKRKRINRRKTLRPRDRQTRRAIESSATKNDRRTIHFANCILADAVLTSQLMNPTGSHERDAMGWQILRNIGFEGRVRMTFQLNNSLRSLSEAGVRHRHPEYDDRRVQLAAIKLAIGPELFKLVYPNENVEP